MTDPAQSPSPFGFVAFGDESASHRRLDPNVYILAAAVLHPSDVAVAREEATALLLPGQAKAHWRDDSERRHDAVIDIIASMAIESVVVVRHGLAGEREERRRRKCLEPFIRELESCGCVQLTLESRGTADDRRDRYLLDGMRAQQKSSNLYLDHLPGPADPLLWIADAICGAIVADRMGQGRWLRALSNRLQLIAVDERPAQA